MQIKTIGDLAKAQKEILSKKLGKYGIQLWEYANGIDNSEVKYEQEKPKSIGNSVTLAENITDMEKLEEILLALAEQVTYRLRKQQMEANVVNIQLRTKDFVDTTHQGKLSYPTASTKEIYVKAKELLKEMYKPYTQIRLVGLKVDNLENKEKEQISLFQGEKDEKQEKLDKVIDKINEKYGYDSITRAKKMELNNKIKFK